MPSPPRHTMSENIFGGHKLGRGKGREGCYGYLAASKARSAAKHCTMHRTAAPLPSQQRNIKVNSAAVDKPRCRRIPYSQGIERYWASLGAQPVKNQAAMQEPRFDPWVQKLLWRREGLPTPGFSPGEFHGQRRLADSSPWACKEFVMTERLRYIHTHTRY